MEPPSPPIWPVYDRLARQPLLIDPDAPGVDPDGPLRFRFEIPDQRDIAKSARIPIVTAPAVK